MKRRTCREAVGRLKTRAKRATGRALLFGAGLAALTTVTMVAAVNSVIGSEEPSSEPGESQSLQVGLARQAESEIAPSRAFVSASETQNRTADLKATRPTDPTAAPATSGLGSGADLSRIGRLKKDVLDLSLAPELRREALAELTRSGIEALPALASVASARFESPAEAALPHSVAAAELTFEKGLRITALEAIDQLATQGQDTREALTTVLTQQTDRDVRLLVNVSLSGIEQGRPGKLKRFIDQAFEEILPE